MSNKYDAYSSQHFHHRELELTAEAAREVLSDNAFASWQALNCNQLVYAEYGTRFVVFTWDGEPNILAVGELGELSFKSYSRGMKADFEIGGDYFRLDHNPSPIWQNKVFLHIPWAPRLVYGKRRRNKDPKLAWPMVIRTEGNHNNLKPGQIFTTRLSDFKQAFPQYREIIL